MSDLEAPGLLHAGWIYTRKSPIEYSQQHSLTLRLSPLLLSCDVSLRLSGCKGDVSLFHECTMRMMGSGCRYIFYSSNILT